MKILLTVFLLTFGASAAVAQQSAPADLLEAEQKWNECIRIRDVRCTESYLAPDYTLGVAEPGTPLLRTQRDRWLANLPEYRISEMHMGDKLVRVYGDTAVVSYPYHQQANMRGVEITGDFLVTDVWVKRSNTWQVSLRLSSRFFSTKSTDTK